MKIYLIGSLRNPEVPKIAQRLRKLGWEVFDDWYAAGPRADDHWQEYEHDRGHTLIEALKGHAARHVFEYDKSHLDRCDVAVLLYPAGKSGHLEFGYMIGQGKPGYIVLDKEPERFDVMLGFATAVVSSVDDLELTLNARTTPRSGTPDAYEYIVWSQTANFPFPASNDPS